MMGVPDGYRPGTSLGACKKAKEHALGAPPELCWRAVCGARGAPHTTHPRACPASLDSVAQRRRRASILPQGAPEERRGASPTVNLLRNPSGADGDCACNSTGISTYPCAEWALSVHYRVLVRCKHLQLVSPHLWRDPVCMCVCVCDVLQPIAGLRRLLAILHQHTHFDAAFQPGDAKDEIV